MLHGEMVLHPQRVREFGEHVTGKPVHRSGPPLIVAIAMPLLRSFPLSSRASCRPQEVHHFDHHAHVEVLVHVVDGPVVVDSEHDPGVGIWIVRSVAIAVRVPGVVPDDDVPRAGIAVYMPDELRASRPGRGDSPHCRGTWRSPSSGRAMPVVDRAHGADAVQDESLSVDDDYRVRRLAQERLSRIDHFQLVLGGRSLRGFQRPVQPQGFGGHRGGPRWSGRGRNDRRRRGTAAARSRQPARSTRRAAMTEVARVILSPRLDGGDEYKAGLTRIPAQE